MLVTGAASRYLRGSVGGCLIAGLLMWGCAVQEPPSPPQAAVEVGKRLATLEECIDRAQRTIKAAADTGVSAGALAPANSALADAQDAVDDVRSFLQQGKTQEAIEGITLGGEECEKIEMMVAKGRQEALERKARAQLLLEAEGRMSAVTTCVEQAREAMESARGTKAPAEDLAAVHDSLESAETALKQAREFLAQSDPKSALGRLDTAQTACKTTQESGEKVGAMFPKTKTAPTKSKRER